MLSNVKLIAENAGKILLSYYDKNLKRNEKESAGFVTEADIASENYIKNELIKLIPTAGFVAEESGESNLSSDYIFSIDPLDGTTNFATKFDEWCVSIALIYKGTPQIGVIYKPITNKMFFAEKGNGAFLNDKKINVNKFNFQTSSVHQSCEALNGLSRESISKLIIATGDYYYRGNDFENISNKILNIYRETRVVRNMGSLTLGFCYTANGTFDGVFHKNYNLWDIAAGALIVREAGGVVSDFNNDKINYLNAHGDSIIAASEPVYKYLSTNLKK